MGRIFFWSKKGKMKLNGRRHSCDNSDAMETSVPPQRPNFDDKYEISSPFEGMDPLPKQPEDMEDDSHYEYAPSGRKQSSASAMSVPSVLLDAEYVNPEDSIPQRRDSGLCGSPEMRKKVEDELKPGEQADDLNSTDGSDTLALELKDLDFESAPVENLLSSFDDDLSPTAT
eukprot:m.338237 g.338237  ORF g.338237 m.338237 type:complete len:172 (+) comp18350_c0_seq1:280-795(+)